MKSMFFSVMVFTLLATTDAFAGPHNVYVNAGFAKGGLAFGADYETLTAAPFGLGGFFRMNQKDKDKGAPGIMSLGAFARQHMTKDKWDFYASPGFGIAMIDAAAGDDETVFGPSLSIGMLYQTSPTVALGLENFHMFTWTGDDYRGDNLQEIMFKGRFNF